MNEYCTEKFIEQYEHIKKLQLLSESELKQLKRKRLQFEVAIKSTNDIKSFINYIKYESVLLKKFKQIEYSNENDGRAINRSICAHIKDIYKQAVKRFQDNRKMWSCYIEFCKLNNPNSVTSIYQQMLAFHHEDRDYIEAANYEASKQNYYVAINFLLQGMRDEKTNIELVALYIECSLKHAEASNDEQFRQRILQQVNKYFINYVQKCKDVQIYIDLLKKIQNLTFSLSFQDHIIKYLLLVFCRRPEVWDLIADRYLNGIFFNEKETNTSSMEVPFIDRLRKSLTIYDKSIELVDEKYKTKMIDLYLSKLMELETTSDLDDCSYSYIQYAFAKTLNYGYKNNCLSKEFYVEYLKLCILNGKEEKGEDISEESIEDIIAKGFNLYSHSMEIYEIAIKFLYGNHKYKQISKLCKQAIQHNENEAIRLYEFLCQVYLQHSDDKNHLWKVMMEAINSNNKQLSAKFQPYILEYYAYSENIEKARRAYRQILSSMSVISLSLTFFTTMIKIENAQLKPDHNIIVSCYERATKIFGQTNTDIWIDYIKYSWNIGKFSEAYRIKKRAVESMKSNHKIVDEFEFKFTMLKNNIEMDDQ